MTAFADPLPIDAVSGLVEQALGEQGRAVLIAPPGAGKTTRLPLLLLNAAWAADGKLVLLEPRRLAARAAAQRMAEAFGEPVGETVGLRVRLESRIGPKTRIEVVTEGVFTRMIIDDPALEGVAAVLFDEFHERSLDADLGLALALDARAGLREDLRLLVMSATLDAARVATLLDDAPLIESRGRSYSVQTRYLGRDPLRRLEDEVAGAVLAALAAEPGSLLAFLPGRREILHIAGSLRARIRDPRVDIVPLFGAMERKLQDAALRPAPPGRRKVVFATSIAETSLTIEGVRIVVDSGLARVPRYQPDLGLTRLETVRASRAAVDQRRGRAGRVEPGVCYRLWHEAETRALEPFAKPEILSTDLSSLVLDLAAWGVREPDRLAWLDPPPRPAVAEARTLLRGLGALDAGGAITPEGCSLRALALPPRLARMVVDAHGRGAARLAADLAVVLVERGLGGDAVDLAERVERFRGEQSPRVADARRLAQSFVAQAERAVAALHAPRPEAADRKATAGSLIALAYPERIAKARGRPGEFLLANGRAAAVEPHDRLGREAYLAVAELAGKAASARILAAAALTLADIESAAAAQIEERNEVSFDPAAAAVRGRRVRRLGAILLSDHPLPVPATEEAARMLATGIAGLGIERLPWTKGQRQWRDRVMFLRRLAGNGEPNPWPDLSDAALADSVEEWLAPFLLGKARLADVTADDVEAALRARLPWELGWRLDREAPTHFQAPTGSRIPIAYTAGGPVLSVRVQELFGVKEHPSVALGRVPLMLELLSPAHRPIQITRDLPGFWRGSWSQVRSEMRGRYPRHFWPDDPANALPTAKAKPRAG